MTKFLQDAIMDLPPDHTVVTEFWIRALTEIMATRRRMLYYFPTQNLPGAKSTPAALWSVAADNANPAG
jgi:hypothetical protein